VLRTMELGHEVLKYRKHWMSGCCSPPNVAFSCWRGLASSVKARQRLYRRKVQGRASPLQRDVRPAVALNSRCYERLRTPRRGVVMGVVLVGACSWLRPGTVKRPSLSLALSRTEDFGTPSAVDRHPPRCCSWARTPPARTLLELGGRAGIRSGQRPRWNHSDTS